MFYFFKIRVYLARAARSLMGVGKLVLETFKIKPGQLDRILIGTGILMLSSAWMLPNRFDQEIGGRKSTITRHDNPLAYWGTECGLIFVGVSLSGFGIYRARKR